MQLIIQKRGYRILPLIALAVAIAMLVLLPGSAGAVPTGPFEIDVFPIDGDGNPVPCATTECPKKSYYSGNGDLDGGDGKADDWAQGSSNNGVFLPSTTAPHTATPTGPCYGSNVDLNPAITYIARFICDGYTGISGAPENSIVSPAGDIPQDIWPVTTSNHLTPKDDISHGYFVQMTQDCNGVPHNIVVVGMERGNNEGSNHWGIELNGTAPDGLQTVADGLSPAADFALDFNRVVGDVYIAVDLLSGGSKPDIIVTQISGFQADGDANYTLATATPCPLFAANRTSTNLVEQLAPPWNVPVCDPTFNDAGPNNTGTSSGANSCRIANGAAEGPTDQGSSSCDNPFQKGNQKIKCLMVPARDFVEVAIDLTAYGVTRTCFADVLLTSVSSGAGTSNPPEVDLSGADIKDLTASVLPPCGLAWEKRSDIDGSLQGGATFTVSPDPFRATCSVASGTLTIVDNDANDSDPDDGQIVLTNICPGNYTITETVAPAGFAKDPDDTRTCNVTTENPNCHVGTQGEADDCPDSTGTPDADGGPAGTDTGFDFCNVVGKLRWTKVQKDVSVAAGTSPFGGASFSVTGPGGFSATVTDGGAGDADAAAGSICLDDVPLGNGYQITETASNSANHDKDNSIKTANVSGSGTCAGTTSVDAGPFVNVPKSQFRIIFDCLVPGAGSLNNGCTTNAQIVCDVAPVSENGDPDAVPPKRDDLAETYTALAPGAYDCTIDIDP